MFRWPYSALLTLTILLAACTSVATPAPAPAAPAPPTQAPAQSTEAPAAATEPPSTAGSSEVVTIEYWIPAGQGREPAVAEVVKAFEATHPTIKVNVTAIPFGEFANALQVGLASDNPPDAAFAGGPDIPFLAYNGALRPVDDLLTAEDRADFNPDLIDMVSLDGVAYGMPFANSGVAMYYNVDSFEAAGVEVPTSLDDVWTWPEFVENVNRVVAHQTEEGHKVWGMVGLDNPIISTFFAWTLVRSGSAPGSPLWDGIAPDHTTVAGYIDTPEALEAYAFYQSLYTSGFAPNENVPDAFGTGQAATLFAIPPTAATLTRDFPDLKWAVMPIPYLKTPLTHTGSFAHILAARSTRSEAAGEFIHFFSSPDGYLTYHATTAMIPGRKSLQDELPELQSGFLKTVYDEILAWGQARPGGPGHSIFNRIVATDMMRNIALGTDIKTAVASTVDEADAQLAQFR
ncbi:MAG: sugar ABC transporter substrate-binding protein [Ardenticatenaceae bacterium]|nr:sugar ABC transporter substrate-binding protein [Ardenticatenaceae bacterium]